MPADSTIRRPTDRRSASRYRHRVRSNTFRYAGSRAGFGVARLFGDRIELMSFELLGPRVRRIYLDSITHMDYHPLQDGGNLGLYLDSGEELHLCMRQAHVWREFYENWLRYDVLPSAKLMPDTEEALTVSG